MMVVLTAFVAYLFIGVLALCLIDIKLSGRLAEWADETPGKLAIIWIIIWPVIVTIHRRRNED